MNLIEELGIETCREIVDGAPEGSHLFFHFGKQFENRVDYYKYFFNHFQMWLPDHGWFPIHEDLAEDALNLENLRIAIMNHGTPTNEGTSNTDNLSHFTDNCTDIRNHISPNTKVIER